MSSSMLTKFMNSPPHDTECARMAPVVRYRLDCRATRAGRFAERSDHRGKEIRYSGDRGISTAGRGARMLNHLVRMERELEMAALCRDPLQAAQIWQRELEHPFVRGSATAPCRLIAFASIWSRITCF